MIAFVRLSVIVLALAALAPLAAAQHAYPNKSVRIIVPYRVAVTGRSTFSHAESLYSSPTHCVVVLLWRVWNSKQESSSAFARNSGRPTYSTLQKAGLDPVDGTSEELAKYQAAEIAKWSNVVKKIGYVAE